MATVNLLGGLALEETAKDTGYTLAFLRRMCRLLESSGNVDSANRQRVTVDFVTPGLTLTAVTTVTNLVAIAGVDHRQFQDGARTAYNTGPRANLIFS